MIRILLAVAILLTASVAEAQPVLTSPACDVTWTRAWVESVAPMHWPKLSFYEVEFAPARTGPWTMVALAIVQPDYGQPVNGVYTAQCPGYVPSGEYWIRLRPFGGGGWHRGKYTPPVMGTLDRGE